MVTNAIPEFTISQDDQYIFIKIKMNSKDFNKLTAQPEVLVYDNVMFEFFAEPYLLRLKFNEQVGNMSIEENEKDVVWSKDGYLCRIKKM